MSQFYLVAVVVTSIVASARLTRLAVYDHFPPVKWLRLRYRALTLDSDWELLAECGYCFSFWSTLVVVLSGYFSHWHIIWWLACGSLAISYLAAMVVANDQDKSGGKG